MVGETNVTDKTGLKKRGAFLSVKFNVKLKKLSKSAWIKIDRQIEMYRVLLTPATYGFLLGSPETMCEDLLLKEFKFHTAISIAVMLFSDSTRLCN